MDGIAQKSFCFESFTLDVLRRVLEKGGHQVDLRPKSFDVLVCLVCNAGRIVAKDEIIDEIWPDVVVTDDSLTRCISDIRRALGDSEQQIIKTIPRRGYLFASPVSQTSTGGLPPLDLSNAVPHSAVDETTPLISRRKSTLRAIFRPKIAAAVFLLMAIAFGSWFWNKTKTSSIKALDRPTIVVLPFVNLSGDIQQNYLSDGISEEITKNLTRSHDLLVIAHHSAFKLGARKTDVQQIVNDHGIRYLLTGSVRRDSKELRVTAQLTDAESGVHLWVGSYDGVPSDLFPVQDDLTKSIISLLISHITKHELDRMVSKPPQNLDAYELTLRGNALLKHTQSKQRGDVISKARALYERAIGLDSTYAPAVEGLANTYLWAWLEPSPGHFINAEFRQQKILDQARTLAQRAVELDETFAEARATLGWILFWEYGPTEGIAEFERAFEFNPSFVDGRYGLLLSHGGRALEAIEYMQQVMRLDPLYSPRFTYLLGKGYFFIGDYEKAIELIRRAAIKMPDHRPSHVLYAAVAAHMDRIEETGAAVAEVMGIHPEFTISSWMKFMRISSPVYAERLISGLRKAGFPE